MQELLEILFSQYFPEYPILQEHAASHDWLKHVPYLHGFFEQGLQDEKHGTFMKNIYILDFQKVYSNGIYQFEY